MSHRNMSIFFSTACVRYFGWCLRSDSTYHSCFGCLCFFAWWWGFHQLPQIFQSCQGRSLPVSIGTLWSALVSSNQVQCTVSINLSIAPRHWLLQPFLSCAFPISWSQSLTLWISSIHLLLFAVMHPVVSVLTMMTLSIIILVQSRSRTYQIIILWLGRKWFSGWSTILMFVNASFFSMDTMSLRLLSTSSAPSLCLVLLAVWQPYSWQILIDPWQWHCSESHLWLCKSPDSQDAHAHWL